MAREVFTHPFRSIKSKIVAAGKLLENCLSQVSCACSQFNDREDLRGLGRQEIHKGLQLFCTSRNKKLTEFKKVS